MADFPQKNQNQTTSPVLTQRKGNTIVSVPSSQQQQPRRPSSANSSNPNRKLTYYNAKHYKIISSKPPDSPPPPVAAPYARPFAHHPSHNRNHFHSAQHTFTPSQPASLASHVHIQQGPFHHPAPAFQPPYPPMAVQQQHRPFTPPPPQVHYGQQSFAPTQQMWSQQQSAVFVPRSLPNSRSMSSIPTATATQLAATRLESPSNISVSSSPAFSFSHSVQFDRHSAPQQVHVRQVAAVQSQLHIAQERPRSQSLPLDDDEDSLSVHSQPHLYSAYNQPTVLEPDSPHSVHSESKVVRLPNLHYYILHEPGQFNSEEVSVELKLFYKSLIPDQDDQMCRKMLISSLQATLHSVWPGAELSVFGSCANGFAMKSSDVDLDIVWKYAASTMSPFTPVAILKKLQTALIQSGVSQITFIPQARVPVLKIADPVIGLDVDIVHLNMHNDYTSQLFNDYARCHPLVQPLAFAVKHWSRCRGIGEARKGTLSAYAFIHLIIQFLQMLRVVPNFQDPVTLSQFKPSPFNYSLGQLLHGFFRVYSSDGYFDPTRMVVSIRCGAFLLRSDPSLVALFAKSPFACLVIEDPLLNTNNVAHHIRPPALKLIVDEMTRARDVLESGGTFEDICDTLGVDSTLLDELESATKKQYVAAEIAVNDELLSTVTKNTHSKLN